jgi:hypothetical protein
MARKGRNCAMTTPHRPFQSLIDAPPWRVSGLAGDPDRLVISFSSVGHDPARPPSPEFVGSATAGGASALFVSDESRSWANAPGFDTVLLAAVAGLPRPPSRVLTIGQSMGAFCALAAAAVLPVQAVLAFGPQFSVDPVQMPEETRWANWTGHIGAFRHPVVPLPQGSALYVFHGLADDAGQARAFSERPGLTHVLFPGLGHSGLVAHLKQRGALAGLVAAALDGDRRRLLRIAASAGGRLRQRLRDQLPR